jgi:hypothetical protein
LGINGNNRNKTGFPENNWIKQALLAKKGKKKRPRSEKKREKKKLISPKHPTKRPKRAHEPTPDHS